MGYSALILAGGQGKRMGYREKALMDINGRTLISLVIERLENVIDNIIISVRDNTQGKLLKSILPGYDLVYDEYENKGPISGILSGLKACKDEYCFVAACDMPFINRNVVKMLFMKSDGFDAAIPRWDDGFLEPLHAVYKCRPMIREIITAIDMGERIILAPIFKLNFKEVKIEEIKNLDPHLKTFMNINTPEEIQQVIREINSNVY